MMQADSLAQLRDIQLPEPISWWPLAPGWWVLIISVSYTHLTLPTICSV